MAYQFFSEADIDKNTGKIKSEFPMWYNPRLIQEIEDEVLTKEGALASGQVPRGQEADYRDNLNRLKDQLEKVKNMSLVDDAKNDKQLLGKAIKDLAKEISSRLPSDTMCKKNLVDPNMEYRQMTQPCIDVKDDNMAELAKACNVPITDGKITREGACKMWKIGTKFMGEYANIEMLRKG